MGGGVNASPLGKPSPWCYTSSVPCAFFCFFRPGSGGEVVREVVVSVIQTSLNSLWLRTPGDAPSYKAENRRSCSLEKVPLLAFRFRHELPKRLEG